MIDSMDAMAVRTFMYVLHVTLVFISGKVLTFVGSFVHWDIIQILRLWLVLEQAERCFGMILRNKRHRDSGILSQACLQFLEALLLQMKPFLPPLQVKDFSSIRELAFEELSHFFLTHLLQYQRGQSLLIDLYIYLSSLRTAMRCTQWA